MNSMTGFAAVERDCGDSHLTVSVRSLNSRFLDVAISLPPEMSAHERDAAKMAGDRFKRGKVDVSVRLSGGGTARRIDEDKAASYMNAICGLWQKFYGVSLPIDEETVFKLVLSNPDIFTDNPSDVIPWDDVAPVIAAALDECAADRVREGEVLKQDLADKVERLQKCAEIFTDWMPRMEDALKNMVVLKFKSLLGDGVDMNRVMQEVAALLVRYTINEEVVRLNSHVESLKACLDEPLPGKRLDFVCQEAGREINTIGSKNPFAEISDVVVDAKDALEAIREQARNVE